jgi:hypothetical protein
MNNKTVRLSKMKIGDFGIIGGDNTVAQLRDNGIQVGCKTNLWLSYVGNVGDNFAAQQCGWNVDDLCTIIEDTDKVSGMPE